MKKIVKFFLITFFCIIIVTILMCLFFIINVHKNSNVSYTFTNADKGVIEAYDLFAETNAQLQINFDPDTNKEDEQCHLLLDLNNAGSIKIKDGNDECKTIDDKKNLSRSIYMITFNPNDQNEVYKKSIQFSKGAYHSLITTGIDPENENMNPFEYAFEHHNNSYIMNALSFYKDYCIYI